MDLADAARHWQAVITHCDHLVAVHRHRKGAGRRYEEMAINRAIVVMAVAAWQAAVEDMVHAGLDAGAPAPGSSLSQRGYDLLAGNVKTAVSRFSTPSAQNSRELLRLVNYDPWPMWTWPTGPFGRQHWKSSDVAARLDAWLKVRHAIAHGASALPSVTALGAVRRDPKTTDPPLHLSDAEDCLGFIRNLTRSTGGGMAQHLGTASPDW